MIKNDNKTKLLYDKSICHVEITPIDCMPRVWREAIAAFANGYKVSVIGEGKSTVYNGIKYHGFERVGRLKRILVRSKNMLKAAVDTGASIIQIHSPELLMHYRYLKRKNKIIVFDSHEFYAIQIENKNYIPSFLRRTISKIYKRFETRACKKIDCVFFPCTIDGKNYFEKRARLSVKLENYSYLLCNLDNKTKSMGNNVIYAGALTEDRGITMISKAIQNTNCNLILCGSFVSKDYEKEIVSSSNKILYKGLMSREELFNIYSRSDIGICTLMPIGQYSILDNMSTKVYEYMQCGLPVIVSNFECYKMWNNKYSFGICVNPEDVCEIANAINYLVSHPEEAHRMGENGRRAVEEEFNWEKESKKMLSVYKTLLDNKIG